MKKLLLLSLIIFLLSSCWSDIEEKWETNSWDILEEKTTILSEEKKEEIDKQVKINELRKKIAVKGLISKWNINIQNQDYTSALIKYIQIHKEIPNDKETILKLWNIYFNLKKFKQAYSYYSKIKEYSYLDSSIVAKTLISSMSLTENNIKKMNMELDSLNLTDEQLFYYKNSISCKMDFHICKQNFHDFFDNKKEELKNKPKEQVWTWKIVKVEKFKELYNIETAFENYKNFQVDDLLYKWALVSAAFFENWDYNIAIEISKQLLEEKKDYKPLLKLVAKSYYELWNYIEAKSYLVKYNKLVKEDKEVSYFLWIIYEKLNEYMLSTIHFKKAIRIWYEQNIDINKRLLYNYYKLDQIEKMLEMLKIIIEKNKDELIIDDYSLAIYYHIINDKLDDAESFSIEALEKFPESEIINWYMWWILMEKANRKASIIVINNEEGNILTSTWKIEINSEIVTIEKISLEKLYEEAELYINKWLEINKKSPMINLVKWKLEASKWESKKAFIYFKKTISLDNNWDFWKIAKQELENIKMNK